MNDATYVPDLVEHRVLDAIELRRQVHGPAHAANLGSPPVDRAARRTDQPDLLASRSPPAPSTPGRSRTAAPVPAGPPGTPRRWPCCRRPPRRGRRPRRRRRVLRPAPSSGEDTRRKRPDQTVRASHRRGSPISGSDGIASAESHMRARVASSVSSTTVSQNARPVHVLLALHLDAQQPLEHRVAGLALAVAAHRLLDPAVRRQQLGAQRVHHVVAVALGRRHERLDPPELRSAARRRVRRRTGPRRPPAARCRASGSAPSIVIELRLHALDVDRERRQEIVQQLREPVARPRPGELEPVGHLVERHPGAEVGRRRATSRSRTAGCSPTTKSTAPGPERGTATSYWPSTRCARKPSTEPTCAPISNGETCASMPLIACISGGMESPWARIIASDDALRGRLQQRLHVLGVRVDPLGPADRAHLGDVGRAHPGR